MSSVLQRNRDRILALIEEASRAAGRAEHSVRLLAVTKSVCSEWAMALVRCGQTDLGENRVEVLERKLIDFREQDLTARWHFIGHIQRNKAARVVRTSDVIHSVDSIRLLQALDRHAQAQSREPEIYLQVKLTDEEAKHGLSQVELHQALELLPQLTHLKAVGLMGMAPRVTAPDEKLLRAQASFEQLALLARQLPSELFASGRPLLSMGMSGDYPQAIAAGADIVRVGSALFVDMDPDSCSSTIRDDRGESA